MHAPPFRHDYSVDESKIQTSFTCDFGSYVFISQAQVTTVHFSNFYRQYSYDLSTNKVNEKISDLLPNPS